MNMECDDNIKYKNLLQPKKNQQGSSINMTENSYHNNQMLGKLEVDKSHLPPSTTTDSNIRILRYQFTRTHFCSTLY
jgi:hypothetical protein